MVSNITARPPVHCRYCGKLMYQNIIMVKAADGSWTRFFCEKCYDFFHQHFQMPSNPRVQSLSAEFERVQRLWERHQKEDHHGNG